MVKRFSVLAVVLFAVLALPLGTMAFMGYGGCMDKCEGDEQCIKECREMYMDKEEAHEEYKKDFRDCFNTCYDLRGPEKDECLERCRSAYQFGRDLPKQ